MRPMSTTSSPNQTTSRPPTLPTLPIHNLLNIRTHSVIPSKLPLKPHNTATSKGNSVPQPHRRPPRPRHATRRPHPFHPPDHASLPGILRPLPSSPTPRSSAQSRSHAPHSATRKLRRGVPSPPRMDRCLPRTMLLPLHLGPSARPGEGSDCSHARAISPSRASATPRSHHPLPSSSHPLPMARLYHASTVTPRTNPSPGTCKTSAAPKTCESQRFASSAG